MTALRLYYYGKLHSPTSKSFSIPFAIRNVQTSICPLMPHTAFLNKVYWKALLVSKFTISWQINFVHSYEIIWFLLLNLKIVEKLTSHEKPIITARLPELISIPHFGAHFIFSFSTRRFHLQSLLIIVTVTFISLSIQLQDATHFWIYSLKLKTLLGRQYHLQLKCSTCIVTIGSYICIYLDEEYLLLL